MKSPKAISLLFRPFPPAATHPIRRFIAVFLSLMSPSCPVPRPPVNPKIFQ